MNKATQTLNAIKVALGIETEAEVSLATMKLDDGVTVIEAEVFEAGNAVMIVTEDEQKIALPVGDYKLEDGTMLIVAEEGVIAEIKEEQAEDEAPETEEEVAATNAPTAAPVAKKVIEAVTKESHFSSDIPTVVLEAIAKVVDDKLAEFKAELSKEDLELSEDVKGISHNPTVELKEAPKGLMGFLNSRK